MPGSGLARKDYSPDVPGHYSSGEAGPINVRVNAPSLSLEVIADPKLRTSYVAIEGDKHDQVDIRWTNGAWTLSWPEDAGVTTIRGSGIIIGNGSMQINSFGGGRRTTIITGGGQDAPRAKLYVPSGSSLLGEINAGTVSVASTDERSGLTRIVMNSQAADLITACPVGNIGFQSASGGLDVNGVTGPVQANTMSGSIYVAHAMGSVQVSTMSGSVTVHAEDSILVSARSMSGDVRVTKAANANPQVQASTMSGRVSRP